LLNADGTLQGAGALIGRAGGTAPYGDGEEADAGAYRFPRVVDYVAAACLLIRQDIFGDIGGFDSSYHPIYFEDAELCLAVREQGYLVFYEPRSVVTHVGGASGFARKRPLVPLRNRFLLERRWRHVLSARPSAPFRTPRQLVAARDAPPAARVLVVAERLEHEGLALGLARTCLRSQITFAAADEPLDREALLAPASRSRSSKIGAPG
jgi:hypothetical protein